MVSSMTSISYRVESRTKKSKALMGPGMVIHLPGLFAEIESNVEKGLKGWEDRLLISDRAHLVMDYHQALDAGNETRKGKEAIGTTKKGIGPTYANKASRTGVRVGDLVNNFEGFVDRFRAGAQVAMLNLPGLDIDIESEIARYKEYAEKIRPLVVDSVSWLTERTRSAEEINILVEGANATMLDLDHGTYPFVTSSSCSIGGVCTGLGLPPCAVGDVFGVAKAYCTRVGGGPFPTELENEIGEKLQKQGGEFGVTTGRPRRCGWLDLVQLDYADQINHFTALAITKLDVMDNFETVKVCVGYKNSGTGDKVTCMPGQIKQLSQVVPVYEEFPGWMSDTTKCETWESLPEKARTYINFLEKFLKIPIRWIGVGPARESIIFRSGEVSFANTGAEL
ncbi:Oidioi.mRNA.OKI2018_I69.chr2.g7088.t1.cds [Oikopleura dioica]|uniref:Adenylosuccinate synthetase n=1 Tax=Oikopleura dioica TaxID=34765 RepID=A0ABN7TB44_OIKDI|nr:Oidioi.mRNA.OKI2018_I69.chr2.g7088.t1.cds [Oikopleura dioica]